MKVDYFVDIDWAKRVESLFVVLSNFFRSIAKNSTVPLFLLDKLLAELLASRTAILDIDIARPEQPQVEAGLHHIACDDPLTTMTLQRTSNATHYALPPASGLEGSVSCILAKSRSELSSLARHRKTYRECAIGEAKIAK